MSEVFYTAEEVYTMIDSRKFNKSFGIKLIENYGIGRQRETVETMQKVYGGYSTEIESVINRINAQLDEMLKTTVDAYTHREGL